MTIFECALLVLKEANKPLTNVEIYELIKSKNLFIFNAKNPLSVINSQLRKHTLGFTGKNASQVPLLKQSQDKKYSLIVNS